MHERQEMLVGKKAQKKINKSTVVVLGVGALGTVAAELLVRAGIGSLIIIDRDVVEASNLSRQTLYSHRDIGRSKVIAAKERLDTIEPNIKVTAQAIHFNARNCGILGEADLIMDCTDNLEARFVLNDYCRKESKRWVYAAAIRTSGYVMPILPGGPCVRCFLQEAPLETCETAGVINTITVSIAALQVQIALELLWGKTVKSELYHYDLEAKTFRKLAVVRNIKCPTCRGRFEYLIPKKESTLIQFCGSGRYQINGAKKNLLQLRERWARQDHVQHDGTTLRFKNILLFADGRTLIKANSEAEALATYSKWVGN